MFWVFTPSLHSTLFVLVSVTMVTTPKTLQQTMLTLVNSTELNLSVLPGRFTICKFKDDVDGTTSSCVGATSANKVFYNVSIKIEQNF